MVRVVDLPAAGLVKPMNAAMNDLDGLSGRFLGHVNTSPASEPENALYGPDSAPADLIDFVRSVPVRDAVRALGLAQGTVHRLRNGYWPTDPRRILRAWSTHKGRAGVASSWFLRRVRSGGVVLHGRLLYTSPGLGVHVGELVAVARGRDGGLVAQALELPLQRFALERVES